MGRTSGFQNVVEAFILKESMPEEIGDSLWKSFKPRNLLRNSQERAWESSLHLLSEGSNGFPFPDPATSASLFRKGVLGAGALHERGLRATMPTETLEHLPTTDTRLASRISVLLLRIQGEYREMPGLKLTEAQARRLWDLDDSTCSVALTKLLECQFLKRTASGTYVRASD